MDLVRQIEQALGEARLAKLRSNEDNYQIFWLGVLEHRKNIDQTRDPIPYLLSCGYGAIRNEYLKENTRAKYRWCPVCGRRYSYRQTVCKCGRETVTDRRIVSPVLEDGSDVEFPCYDEQRDLEIDIQRFVSLLQGVEKYVATRWLVDRADLHYNNHLKQIASEIGCSAPYVAKVKKNVRNKWIQLMQ